ncbi:MAG TPA: hypothetical protein VNQ79_06605 [Blastocatellia bacterium]|nr:hypothetical protein [Blastocatellia bacterium]
MIPELFKSVIGSLVRWALAGLFGWLVARGVLTPDQTEALTAAAIVGASALAWSVWQKYRSLVLLKIALDLPANSTLERAKEEARAAASAKNLALLLALALLLPSVLSLTGCGEPDQKKLLAAAADIYVGLKAASDITEALNRSGGIADPDALLVYRGLDRAGRAVRTFKERVRRLDTITANEKVELLPLLGAAIDDLERLQTEGVTGFKSAKAQADFRAAIATARAGLVTIKVFVAAIRKPAPVPQAAVAALP